MWRIGDARSVHIMGDRRLPRPSTYKIQSPCPGMDTEATVTISIDHSTASWNVLMVRDIFDKEEVDLICLLPLSRYKQKDLLMWRYTSSGEFTVRSAYFLEKERRQRELGEGSSPSSCNVVWKIILQLKVSNPTKSFLWRACSNILPTRVNLCKRGVVENDLCTMCGREPESVAHALWSCPVA